MGKLPDFAKEEKKDMDFSTLTDGKALRAKIVIPRGKLTATREIWDLNSEPGRGGGG